jgi:hypothetical protein
LADNLIDLFANKTIQSIDLVALIGAHTAGKQRFFDTTQANKPFDATPGVWDVAFYSDLIAGRTPEGTFHLPSDGKFSARVNGTRNAFLAMANGFPADNSAGQIQWNGLYSKGYVRLSLLGVKNIQGLTDCTKVLPVPIKTFDGPRALAPTCQSIDYVVPDVPDETTGGNGTVSGGNNGTIFAPSAAAGPSKTPGSPESATSTSSTVPAQATVNAAGPSRVLGGGLLSLMAAAMAFAL